MEQLCEMGDAVLADPQGQKRLPISVRLSEAFNNALDMETACLWPKSRWPEAMGNGITSQPVVSQNQNVQPLSMDDGLKLIDAWMAKRNKRKYESVERDVARPQVKFPRHERGNEYLGSGNTSLSGWQGQTPLATGVWNNGAYNIAPQHEITPGRRMSQELACKAAVAEPGNQTPGVAVNGVALRLPLLELPSDNHDATASLQEDFK
jgi:hypothetical protein